jgi:hypothetical protein
MEIPLMRMDVSFIIKETSFASDWLSASTSLCTPGENLMG